MDTFISGLIAVLTPSVFPLVIAIPIIFERLGKSNKRHKVNIILFAFLTITIFLFTTSWFLKQEEGVTSLSDNYSFDIIINIFQIIFLIWFLTSFFKRFEKLRDKNWLIIFSLLGIGIFSYRLALSSLSNVGPIVGMVLVSGNGNEELKNTMWLLLFFSIGLIVPFVIIQYLLQKQYQKLNSKNWWRILQIIVAGTIILTTLIKLLNNSLIYYTENLP